MIPTVVRVWILRRAIQMLPGSAEVTSSRDPLGEILLLKRARNFVFQSGGSCSVRRSLTAVTSRRRPRPGFRPAQRRSHQDLEYAIGRRSDRFESILES